MAQPGSPLRPHSGQVSRTPTGMSMAGCHAGAWAFCGLEKSPRQSLQWAGNG